MLEIPPHESFYVQVVLFLVFAAVLRALIWTPTLRVLEERAKRTSGAQEEAARMRDEAAALQRELDVKLEEARREGGDAGEKVRRDAEAEERRLVDAAHAEAAHVLDEVRQRIARESAEARTAMQAQVEVLARVAAERILGRSVTS
jgi:F-type H+-transporting ATPase subunit b